MRRSPPSAPRFAATGSSATSAARATRCARCRACCSSPAGTEEAEPVVLEAVRLLEQLPPGHELAMAYGNVAQRRIGRRGPGGRRSSGHDARWSSPSSSATPRRTSTHSPTIGGAEFQVDWPEARHKLEHALRARPRARARRVRRPRVPQLVLCAQRTRRYDVAGANLDAGIAYCEERGLDTWRRLPPGRRRAPSARPRPLGRRRRHRRRRAQGPAHAAPSPAAGR